MEWKSQWCLQPIKGVVVDSKCTLNAINRKSLEFSCNHQRQCVSYRGVESTVSFSIRYSLNNKILKRKIYSKIVAGPPLQFTTPTRHFLDKHKNRQHE